ncbi:alpha-ketoglutarate-dependent dioxygenase AlkB [Bernardetia sp.]|uniref:alpha-ketoglutarate-dependent dioxygenase AlkB n=1 Tax=Bernardetia sp. TaxID=1937974 RepID=UPI0025B9FD63|nr:alpha-ketoglutarate-dependent dioxygenase AlkB [Bernardetia sp.]
MKQLVFFQNNSSKYKKIYLDEEHYILMYYQVEIFKLNETEFDILWNEHPAEFHEVVIHGKKIKTPRWQQAYGKNYEYTGSKNNALPLDRIDEKYLMWCQENIDERLNGLLLNWYEGKNQHYIGKHRDSIKGLEEGSPIVTVSLGEERIFRLRPYGGQGYQDYEVKDGDVLVIPWETNQNYTHEVPHFQKYKKRRISVTLRAYK